MEQITFEKLPEAVSRLFEKIDNIERLLSDTRVTTNKQLKLDEVLTVTQAAQFLNLAIPTIYALVSKREIPFNKPGKRLYFSKAELTEWVKAGRKNTTSEMEAEVDQHLGSAKRKG